MASTFEMAGVKVKPGEYRELDLKVSEFYTAQSVHIPIFVKRAPRDGPILFVTAAIHGDEINGVQIVRDLGLELRDIELRRGTFVGVPVVNRFGFLNHERDMPDRRDLNRTFPGRVRGSLATRFAHRIFTEIIRKCTYGIDLHTAGVNRTNLPQIRANLNHRPINRLARAFGTELVFHHPGTPGSLRAEATRTGIPTITYEAGETFRFQRDVVRAGKQGVLNVMGELGMLAREPVRPRFQIIVKHCSWIRAEKGGLLDVYVQPGDLVYKGDEIAVITSPFGREVASLRSPFTGLVISTVTLPLVNPGNPIAHVVKLDKTLPLVEKFLQRRTGPNFVPLRDVETRDPAATFLTNPPLGGEEEE